MLRKGRSENDVGAHCYGEMNYLAVGICVVGNYEVDVPEDSVYNEVAMKCKEIMRRHPGISVERIQGHRDHYPTACPGKNFDVSKVREIVKEEKIFMESIFKDVDPQSWSYEAIKYCYESGIINGFPDETFKPQEPLTREQLAAVLYKQQFRNGIFESGLLKEAIKSVVLIYRGDGGLGSGFCVERKDGYSHIITNQHVVDGFEKFTLIKNDGSSNVEGVLVRANREKDLAIIKTDRELPPMEVTNDISIGQPVAIIGAPKGHTESVTVGIISSLQRSHPAYGSKWFQTDAPNNPGNSGGPVINERGQVVGVAVAKYVAENVEGIGYVIQPDELLAFLGR